MKWRIARDIRRHEKHLDECGWCGENSELRIKLQEQFENRGDSWFYGNHEFVIHAKDIHEALFNLFGRS